SQLFASRRGSYQLARAWANYPEETGHYSHGVFEEADFGPAEQPAESDPCFLRKLFLKTRGSYHLVSAEIKAIHEVKEFNSQWHPKEPRPSVVFAEWRLPSDDDLLSLDYYYRFHFPMHTQCSFNYLNSKDNNIKMFVQGVRQVPSCGCVDPRPTSSTPWTNFHFNKLCETLAERPTMVC
ncbi:hypothetical protein NPIL_351251, partial [Nephila pilipes]